ncbi:MAG TPA: disulfide bond formation protein B [Pseudomonadales bacterium]|nr:disulfide bond formation protein B [Pseudomonadales bacterium]
MNSSFVTKAFSTRGLFGLMAAASAGLMAFALYLQHILGEHPCPLCITQRLFVIAIGIIAFAAAAHNPAQTGRRIWSILILSGAIGGGIVAARHVWIQHLPEEQVPACGPDLAYMFQNFPFQRAVQLLFMGDGNCAQIGWTLLGFSIPEWTLLAFSGFAIAALIQFFRKA